MQDALVFLLASRKNITSTLVISLIALGLFAGFLWSVLREPKVTTNRDMRLLSKAAVAGHSTYSSRIGGVMQTFPARAPSFDLELQDIKGSRKLEVNVSEALGNGLNVGDTVTPRIEERGIPFIFPLYQVYEVKKVKPQSKKSRESK